VLAYLQLLSLEVSIIRAVCLQFPGFPQIPVAAMTQQATRHARRVYVGGLPPMANEQVRVSCNAQKHIRLRDSGCAKIAALIGRFCEVMLSDNVEVYSLESGFGMFEY
jgi:hypothetical protein